MTIAKYSDMTSLATRLNEVSDSLNDKCKSFTHPHTHTHPLTPHTHAPHTPHTHTHSHTPHTHMHHTHTLHTHTHLTHTHTSHTHSRISPAVL